MHFICCIICESSKLGLAFHISERNMSRHIEIFQTYKDIFEIDIFSTLRHIDIDIF